MRETKNFSMVNLSQAQGVALPSRRPVASEPTHTFDFSTLTQGSFDETFPEEDDEPADIEATPPPVAAAALVEPPQTTLAASLNMARSMSMPQFATGPGRPAAPAGKPAMHTSGSFGAYLDQLDKPELDEHGDYDAAEEDGVFWD